MSFAAPILKAGMAAWQLAQYNKLKNTQRPMMDIPQSAKDALQNAQMLASQTQLPGQGATENKLSGMTSQAIDKSKEMTDSPATLLGQVAGLVGKEQSTEAGLSVDAAKMWQTNQTALRGAENQNAAWQQKVWDYNVKQPYQNKMNTAGAMLNAAMGNVVSGVQGGANAAMSIKNNEWYKQYLNSMNGTPQGSGLDGLSPDDVSGGGGVDRSTDARGGISDPMDWYKKLMIGGSGNFLKKLLTPIPTFNG